MNNEEFSQFYKQNLDKVFRFIYLRVDKVETAEDITSQTFLKCWQTNDNSQSAIKNLQAFVYRVARNQIIDFYRQKNKKPLSLEELREKGIEILQKSFVFKIELSFEMENLKKVLQRISPAYSEIIIWHYVDDLSTEEIAQILNKKENNVRVLLHRALETLKKEVNKEV
jgi:RNA polymerase sigma-70 factor, ECF subfamily